MRYPLAVILALSVTWGLGGNTTAALAQDRGEQSSQVDRDEERRGDRDRRRNESDRRDRNRRNRGGDNQADEGQIEQRNSRMRPTHREDSGRDDRRRRRQDRRNQDRQRNDDDQWFDPDWWHEYPNGGDRRDPDGRRDDQWFDPGWWHDYPYRDGRREDPRWDGRWRDRRGGGYDPGYRYRDDYRDWNPDRNRYGRWERRNRFGNTPRPQHATLGVILHDNRRGGVYIQSVVEGSPAAVAGLSRGDRILTINGQSMRSAYELARTLRLHRPGDRVRIRYLRDGNRSRTTAVLAPRRDLF